MPWLDANPSLYHWLNVAEPVVNDPSGEGWFQWLLSTLSAYGSTQTPAPGSAFTPIMGPELGVGPSSDPQGSLAKPKQGASQQQQVSADGRQYVRGAIPSNIDPSVVDGVLRAAQEMNIPYPLALAIVQHESGFDPNAVGDHGCSIGVVHLNTCTGEGVGVPDYILRDPYLSAKISFQKVREVMQQNPNMSWGEIAAAAQRPADASGYASIINDFVDQVQTGQGTMGWGLSTIRVGDPSFQHNAMWGANSVPQPFNSDYFQNITESFGEDGEQGTDFGMPVGQTIYTPVGGTIQTRDDGKANWGKAVYVKTPGGWTFFVGHLSNFSVRDGEQVGPGDVLGASGGDPRDPSSGHSTGPHIEIRIIDPSGQNHDPMPFLSPVYSGNGTTFDKWMGGVFSGAGQPGPQKQNVVFDPNGFPIDLNTPEGAWYKTVDSAWTSVYGVHAPLQAARDFRNAGVTTVDALNNAILQMPSSIPGVTIGSYKNVSDAAQKASAAAFGRPIPQSLIQQFFQQGVTTADDMKLWFDTHSSSDIPQADYQAIYDSALPYTQALYNDVPHPNDVMQVHSSSQSAQDAMNQINQMEFPYAVT